MTERRSTDTGPVTLPENPSRVAQGRVNDLADLGLLHRPPTAREYEHAALEVALSGAPSEQVYAVLAHLSDDELKALGDSLNWIANGVMMLLSDRGHEDPLL